MADYSHRRAASELAYRQATDAAVYGQKHLLINQRPGSSGAVFTHSTMSGGLNAPRMYGVVNFDGNNYANTNFHFRSQSYESPYCWDSYVGSQPVSAPPTGHSWYGSLVPAEARAQHMQLALPNSQRRGSESSTSSAVSNCTATAEGMSAWSAATTPETMSPTSPNNSLLLRSPPERTSSKAGPVALAPLPSPSKVPNQTFIPCRPARARAFSHSAPKRFQNTVIESPVLEEEEQMEVRRNGNRLHQKHASQEVNTVKDATTPSISPAQEEAKAISNLRQRRQQRQLNIAGNPHTKQPVRLRLSPLPPLPLDQQGSRASSAPSPRTLKTSRSSPQLRDAVGPPPRGPLPPLPGAPDLSQQPPPMPRTPAMPPTPSFSSTSACPPHPTLPPPPPPSRPSMDSPGLTLSPRKFCPTTELKSTRDESLPQEQGTPWEEELRRHKKLLEQFPPESEECHDLPKLYRSHRSLGNIRARSRSLSRATGASFHSDAAIAESRLSHHASSFSLRGPKMQRPSTAKSSRDTESRAREAKPSQSQANTPHISVFEDDSDEEGDTVRKFVRNLFTRRIRSGEVPVASPHAADQAREVSLGSKHSVSPAKPTEGNGHNDRKKNHSASSNFSVATTVGASTVVSTTTTLDPSSAEGYHDGCEVDCHPEGGSSSSRTSSDHSRQHQKGPLLSRMFVRRSH